MRTVKATETQSGLLLQNAIAQKLVNNRNALLSVLEVTDPGLDGYYPAALMGSIWHLFKKPSILTSSANDHFTSPVLPQTGLLVVPKFKFLSCTFLYVINAFLKSVPFPALR